MARTTYLKQVGKGGTGYFQCAVPVDIQTILPQKSLLWSMSLRTDSRAQAEQLVHKHISKTDDTIRLARLQLNQADAIRNLPAANRRMMKDAGGVDGLISEVSADVLSEVPLKTTLKPPFTNPMTHKMKRASPKSAIA